MMGVIPCNSGKLYEALVEIFNGSSTFKHPKDAPTLYEASICSLNNSLFKKYHGGVELDLNLKIKTLQMFEQANDRCKGLNITQPWLGDETLEIARSICHKVLTSGSLQACSLNLADAALLGRPGPGSSIGTKHTSFFGKMFESEITVYDHIGLYRFYQQNMPDAWKSAEHLRAKLHGTTVVDSANLTFARKNAEIGRTINTEASVNMFFQLGLGSQLEEALRLAFNINLSTQPRYNKELARLGSIDGRIATIDLKQASDLNSTGFVRFMLPRSAFNLLDTTRAKHVRCKELDAEFDLAMFSCMGNGFTFPLQTLLFACVVKAVYLKRGLSCHNKGNMDFGVFGDDIVVKAEAYDDVCQALSRAGHIVNHDKSYNDGAFRESCGGDFWKGHDIRGVYIQKLSDESSIYSAFNRLARFSAMHGVDLLPALQLLRGAVSYRPVPFDVADTAGLKLPLSMCREQMKFRSGRWFYSFIEPPKSMSFFDATPNNDGLLQAIVGGYVRARNYKPFSFSRMRDEALKWRIKRGSTPSWDWLPHRGLTTLALEIALSGL